MFVYAVLAIGWVYHIPGTFLQLISNVDRLVSTIWLVLSLIGNALAVSVVGLLLGPIYLICMNEAMEVLLRGVLTGSIGTLTPLHVRALTRGWIAGSGTAGSCNLAIYDW